ncbi:MAG: hypothetical protein V4616_14410, partial [Bacteroidota bacterium]
MVSIPGSLLMGGQFEIWNLKLDEQHPCLYTIITPPLLFGNPAATSTPHTNSTFAALKSNAFKIKQMRNSTIVHSPNHSSVLQLVLLFFGLIG